MPDAGLRPQVMIPQKDLAWLVELPESVLNARAPQAGRFAIPYLAPTLKFQHDMAMIDVFRKDLTRSLGKMQPEVVRDMRASVDMALGTDLETWKEINLWDAMSKITFRTSNFVLVGKTLACNEFFTGATAMFATILGLGAVTVGQLLPPIFKPIVGYLFAIPIYIAQKVAFSYMIPQIKARSKDLKHQRADPSFDWQRPDDMLMWMTAAAMDRNDPKADKPVCIAERMLFFMLGGIHTTVMTATNELLNLLSSPEEFSYLSTLREEAEATFPDEESWTDHANVGQLHHFDSALRETLRRNPVLTRVTLREVIHPNGLDLPSGEHLSRGTWVAVPPISIHHDANFYLRLHNYEPFRFVRQMAPNIDSLDCQKAATFRKPETAATASDTYLGFGFGRHSCPGRWFVTWQLKLLFAYIFANYEFKPLGSRPENFVFGDSYLPSSSIKIRVRRRGRGEPRTMYEQAGTEVKT